MTRYLRAPLIAALIVLTWGCALKYKTTTVNLVVATETALGQFQDALRATCNPTVAPMTPIADCTQASQAIGLTTPRFRQASAELAKAFVYVRDDLEPALRRWSEGDPAPQEYVRFFGIVDEAVRVIRPMVNDKTKAIFDAVVALTEALGKLGDAINGKMPPITLDGDSIGVPVIIRGKTAESR